MSRAQAIVHRGCEVLMVKHRQGGADWWCLPGGAIQDRESPAEAALRELAEECHVIGRVVRPTSGWGGTPSTTATARCWWMCAGRGWTSSRSGTGPSSGRRVCWVWARSGRWCWGGGVRSAIPPTALIRAGEEDMPAGRAIRSGRQLFRYGARPFGPSTWAPGPPGRSSPGPGRTASPRRPAPRRPHSGRPPVACPPPWRSPGRSAPRPPPVARS